MKKIYQKAFTLIELLIVVAILGIMAAATLIAIDPVSKINSAKDTTVKSDLGQLVNALQAYNTINSVFPDSLDILVSSGELKSTPKQQTGAYSCAGAASNTTEPYCYTVNTGDYTYPPTSVSYSAKTAAAVWGYTWGKNGATTTTPVRAFYWCWDSAGGIFKYITTSVATFPTAGSPVCP